MPTVNMHEAATNLSKLVEAVETGAETEVIIARNGRPIARLVPIAPKQGHRHRIGIARGLFIAPEPIDGDNAIIEALFTGASR